MNPLLKNLAAAAVLASTAVLLVADSARECSQAAQDVTFDVTQNTCGAAGTLRLTSTEDSCDITVETEEATGLPRSGDTQRENFDLRQADNWYLYETGLTFYVGADGGTVSPDAGGATPISGNRQCDTFREGEVLKLHCEDRRADLSGVDVGTCEAVLTPR